MDSQKHSQKKPKIILKFKNPSTAMEGNKDDYSIGEEELGDGYLHFGAYGAVDGSTKSKKTAAYGGGGGGSGNTESAAVEGEMMLSPYYCQVDNCVADLSLAKRYHRRHKVCEVHAKAPVVVVARIRQRFCQQCSRFHELSEFDEARRSCRNRLAEHNERRRKSSSDAAQVDVEGSSRQSPYLRMKRHQQRQVSERGRAQSPLMENSSRYVEII